MRVLMISTDRNIFDPASAVSKRMVDYGRVLGELHIVVFSLASGVYETTRLADNVMVYPTNSKSKLSYTTDAQLVGEEILSRIYFGQTAITTQDPFETASVGIKLKKKFGFPLQIQLHTDLYSPEFFDGSFMNWFRFQMSKFMFRRADGIRVVREKIKEGLVKNLSIPAQKIIVLPVYVDTEKIRNAPITVNLKEKYSGWEHVVLVASRLSPEKNIPLALRAFSRLLDTNPAIGMVIVGQGSMDSKLKSLVRKLKLEQNVVFESWQNDLSSYYKTADVFLNTSNFEGYGMTLVEASAAGCPIITTNIGIAQDFLRDGKNALVCPVRDEKCLSNKLITFFGNPLIRAQLRENIKSDSKQLDISYDGHLEKQKQSFEMLFETKKV